MSIEGDISFGFMASLRSMISDYFLVCVYAEGDVRESRDRLKVFYSIFKKFFYSHSLKLNFSHSFVRMPSLRQPNILIMKTSSSSMLKSSTTPLQTTSAYVCLIFSLNLSISLPEQHHKGSRKAIKRACA